MCTTRRHTYRCQTCLAVYVVEQTKLDHAFTQCGICNSRTTEYLGVIGRDNRSLTQQADLCKCDARCVWASGPKCDCQCGGLNHQTGQAAYTTVTLDRGTTTLTCTDPQTVGKHTAIAREYLDALCAAESRRISDALAVAFDKGEYIPSREQWLKARKDAIQFHAARKIKVHSLRIKRLNACFQSSLSSLPTA